jgi:hypothetical protein
MINEQIANTVRIAGEYAAPTAPQTLAPDG